jgi:hypothetical protein
VDFRLRHPTHPSWRATYGWSPERGYWADVDDGVVVVVCDRFEIGFHGDRPVISVLMFLTDWGFVDWDDVLDALHRLPLAPSCQQRPRRGVRWVLRIIENLKVAAG